MRVRKSANLVARNAGNVIYCAAELRNAGGKAANSDGVLKHWQLGTVIDTYKSWINKFFLSFLSYNFFLNAISRFSSTTRFYIIQAKILNLKKKVMAIYFLYICNTYLCLSICLSVCICLVDLKKSDRNS